MSENFAGASGSELEQEIAELSRRIEEKKRELEASQGIVHEKETVGAAVAEHFYDDSASAAATDDGQVADGGGTAVPPPAKPRPVAQDYLDSLSPEAVESLNGYISQVPAKGIRQTIARLKQEEPFLIDAFHDALVTRLYDELKTRGIIK